MNRAVPVFIFFLSIFILTHCGFDTSDGMDQYALARHILKGQGLGFLTPEIDTYVQGPDGRIYAAHEIGNAAGLMPAAALGLLMERSLAGVLDGRSLDALQRLLASMQASVYSACTAALFFAILRARFGMTAPAAFAATACLVFTTYFWTYSRNLFDGVLCSTLWTAAFYFLLGFDRQGRLQDALAAFAFLGAGLITRSTMALPVVLSLVYLGGCLATRSIGPARVYGAVAAVLAPFIAWQGWYNHLRTGAFYRPAVAAADFQTNNALDGDLMTGLAGLLLSPGKSLFVYAPLLLLSAACFPRFFSKHRKEALYVAATAVLWLLFHAKLRSWYGAWGWGPRHFVSPLPLLFLPFAVHAGELMRSGWARLSAFALAAWGTLLSTASILSNWHYRMTLLGQQRRRSDANFVWGWAQSQPVDMLAAVWTNLLRVWMPIPMDVAARASSENVQASNTFNLWLITAVHAGVPWQAAWAVAAVLAAIAAWALRTALAGPHDRM